jgi:RNA polymerase primary sigma factor
MAKEGTYDDGDDFLMRLYANDALQHDLLTPEQETALAGRIAMGDKEARETMIRSNLKLVVKIAREYLDYGLPLVDLINEGNIGLMRAVDKFNPAKGAKLSTYAAWWIKQSIKRGLANQVRNVRMPVHQVIRLGKIRKAEKKLQMQLGYEPSHAEIAKATHLTEDNVRMVFEWAQPNLHLEAQVRDFDNTSLADILADHSAKMPFDDIESSDLLGLLRKHLSRLDKREQRILTLRFGLDDSDPMTLDEVGKFYGVTRERIRQIQAAAFKKLRVAIDVDSAEQDPDLESFIARKVCEAAG